MTRPLIGVHYDVPDPEYRSWRAASNSMLNKLIEVPALAKHEMENPSAPTPDLVMGLALHARFLEPEGYDEKFAPGIDGKTAEGKLRLAEYLDEYQHDYRLNEAKLDQVEGMVDAILNHPKARQLIDAIEHRETSLSWVDKSTGCLCKARVDGLLPSLGVAVDLKTTNDASKIGFSRSIIDYGYYRQGAHYLSGLRHLGEPYSCFTFIAVEKKEPYLVAVHELSLPWIRIGELELERAYRQWRQCLETGCWPGYEEIIEQSPPEWKLKQMEALCQ